MNRPWVIWFVLVGCALLILGAVGFLTDRMLGMEDERARAEADGEVEELVRLSLSRMDALASGFLIIEGQRPPVHYEAFYAPGNVITNDYVNVSKGIVLQPSPLLSDPPEFIQLHFEIKPGQILTSPQVPVGNLRDLAESSGISAEELNRAGTQLEKMRGMLSKQCIQVHPAVGGGTNFDLLAMLCSPAMPVWNKAEASKVEENASWVTEQRQEEGNAARQTFKYQKELSAVDQGRRAQNLAQQQDWGRKDAMKKSAPSPKADDALQLADLGQSNEAKEQRELEITPFRPVWIGENLFAVRHVVDEDGPRYQGFWLRSEELKSYLLENADLLKAPDLEPIEALVVQSLEGAEVDNGGLEDEPRALVTLPWRLVVGPTSYTALAWTPLRASMVIGWIAVILALLAAAGLVRSVLKMSERRAAFVSSVTHELRTPLTTFQLYSDMLASGMVKEEEKRQGYLDTLCLEAGRLNHLIENVLSYSQIERGSARTRHETLQLCSLLERFRSRTGDRVEQEGGSLEIECKSDCEVDTDVTAVEQIVFNLVDNACKYGMSEDGKWAISLTADVVGGKARIAVCDEGCGIDRKDLKKLFRPFHKSAKEAAHSKPGVGLGLALSRRLAKALGGELRVEKVEKAGACFVLELPVKR